MLWNCETVAHKGEEWVARRVKEACQSLWAKAEGEPAIAMHVCNPSVCAVEAGGSGVQGQPGLYQAMSQQRVGSSQQKIRKRQMLD